MKRRTKKLSIKRMSFMAEALRDKLQKACCIEVVCWGWTSKKKAKPSYNLYVSNGTQEYLSWDKLEDAFAELMGKEELI